MGRIQPILLSLKDNRSEQFSFALVNHWIEDLCGSPDGFSQEWEAPRKVEAGAPNPTINWTASQTEQLYKDAHILPCAYSGVYKYRATGPWPYAKN